VGDDMGDDLHQAELLKGVLAPNGFLGRSH
jgi:hypothetical protein